MAVVLRSTFCERSDITLPASVGISQVMLCLRALMTRFSATTRNHQRVTTDKRRCQNMLFTWRSRTSRCTCCWRQTHICQSNWRRGGAGRPTALIVRHRQWLGAHGDESFMQSMSCTGMLLTTTNTKPEQPHTPETQNTRIQSTGPIEKKQFKMY